VLSGWVILLVALLLPGGAQAQLEILLRGLDPAPPRAGAWGRYRFTAEEPSGPRSLVFEARIERIEPGANGSVFLRLTSGDSLAAHVAVGKDFFAGRGGALLDAVRSIVEVSHGDTTRVARSDWTTLPGFDPAPALPGARDSLLGERDLDVGGTLLRAHGRRLREQSRQVRELGDVTMTQVLGREIDTWSAATAPLLGLVRAEARIWSEKAFSQPIPGVPMAGMRTWHYTIELLRCDAAPAPPPRKPSAVH
jgi:hypothetical protein